MSKPEAYALTGQEVGRTTAFRPQYCELIIEYAKEGKGPIEWAAAFDVCRATIYNWKEAFPQFLDAWTRAEIQLQAWWENAGRVGMVSDKFNSAVWAKNMSCRFRDDWRDVTRTEQTGLDGGPIKQEHQHSGLDALESRIDSIAARLGAADDPSGTNAS